MDSVNIINSVYKVKDISKGQKLVAALYLVTSHLSDNDPIKSSIRNFAVSLIMSPDISPPAGGFSSSVARAVALLESASIAGLVNEKNVSIIVTELNSFVLRESSHTSSEMKSFFGGEVTTDTIKRTLPNESLSFRNPNMSVRPKKSQTNSENKNKRQKDILSFIDKKKSVGIKDIASLLSDISEKTIQRELNLLVQKGQITKRGTKRWSTYMAVAK